MDLFNQKEKPRAFERIPLVDGEVLYMPNFMPMDKANSYFKTLLDTISWRQEEIKLFGKVHPVPRKTAWYGYEGFNYKYSGILCNPEPWTKELLDIKKVIEHFLPSEDFNSVLLNLYRDGNDKVSWHADDEQIARSLIERMDNYPFEQTKDKAIWKESLRHEFFQLTEVTEESVEQIFKREEFRTPKGKPTQNASRLKKAILKILH